MTTNPDWRANLQPILTALESDRQAALKSVTKSGIVIGGIAFFIGAVLWAWNHFSTLSIFLIPILIGIAIFVYVYSKTTSTYRNGFKYAVLPQLVAACAQEFDGNLQYTPGTGISEHEYRNCDLFRAADRYSSEDLVTGNIGTTAVRFSEVHAEELSGGKNKSYQTVFKGLFFVADFNKKFYGSTVVRPDTAEQVFGNFGQSLQQFGAKISFRGQELVRLEDPDFERQFVVFSTDQIEARYILSPALMKRLMDFRARCKTDIHVSFSGGNLILAIPVGVGWLEPPGLSTPLTLQSLGLCLDQLRFACSIVAELDLNTRIWSK